MSGLFVVRPPFPRHHRQTAGDRWLRRQGDRAVIVIPRAGSDAAFVGWALPTDAWLGLKDGGLAVSAIVLEADDQVVTKQAGDGPAISVPAPAQSPWVATTSVKATGEQHGAAKLTWPQVRESAGNMPLVQAAYSLARKAGVHPGTITAI